MDNDTLTPMMRQYRRIKGEQKDAVLFFRLGDFYEMFERDAKEVSRILNITLTTRHNIPMCGIPYHAAGSYIPRLLKAGKKIAICEQIALPEGGKGIAERKVVEIITPGTVVEQDYLDSNTNNYLLSLALDRDMGSITYIDISTGEFQCTAFPWEQAGEVLRKEFRRLKPKEIIIQESVYDNDEQVRRILSEHVLLTINRVPDWNFSVEDSYRRLKSLFKTSNLKGFGITEGESAIFSTGALLQYLEDTSHSLLFHIHSISIYTDTDNLGLDESTQKNLELVQNMQDGSSQFTLLDVLDHTKTPMGARNIRKWILKPLNDCTRIRQRLDAVELFYHNQMLLNRFREQVSNILDLERLSARVGLDKAHGKDLLSLKTSLDAVLMTVMILEGWEHKSPLWVLETETVAHINELMDLLSSAVHDDPSVLLTEGRLIKEGYSTELDSMRNLRDRSQGILDEYVDKERIETGIGNLKIKYNKIIGYFFDVSKGNLANVPSHFIRRQTLVNGERFTTDTLIDIESKLNSAVDDALEMEKKLFIELRNTVKTYIPHIQRIADFIAVLDTLASFAFSATIHGYTKPNVQDAQGLDIQEGRHPIVEKNLPAGDFVGNSLHLNDKSGNFALITGPNMAGKSTFLRQNALIVLMAQIGSFVSAADANIGLVDRIFCRVGASDNLARGESTFLVEMNETANILRSATQRSFVIMDEVGRGTGTNDGLAIAWAVSDFLIQKGVKTLFATHYHELTGMQLKGMFNLSLEVLESAGEIVFLKRIKKGPSGNSYGIHVARLAGLPAEVIEKARQLLERLVEREQAIPDSKEIEEKKNVQIQGTLFNPQDLIVKSILSCNVNSLTPLEALNMIAAWKKTLEEKA